MPKFTTSLVGVALATTVLLFGSVTSAQAQSCGNSNVQTSSGEVCDNGGANNTQAVGCCAAGCAAFVTGGTTCRAASGSCDLGAETCSGTSGACPADAFAPTSQQCRASLAGVCDSAEFCTGTGNACPPDTVALASVVCRGAAGDCDAVENCDGSTGACPADLKSSALCRIDAGSCDAGSEFCDGVSNNCPADNVSAGGTLCRSAVGDCDAAESCDGTAGACPADTKSTSLCRASAGECDEADFCDGVGNNCPADAKSTDECRASEGVCDPAESCNGTANTCPADIKSVELCRASSGICDQGAETCDGTNADCPADVPADTNQLCRGSVGDCDEAESCTGTSSECPDDDKKTSVCRASAGECDLEESCDGIGNNCPGDAKSEEVCRPAVSEVCDVEESCDGVNDACPNDELVDCQDDDGVACTEATCDATEGCIIADNCVEICRSPGFWSTHSGDEKGENVGQAVLDDVGSIIVCGEEIDTTIPIGTLDSSLEGLCMRTQGVKDRQLYRQLVAAAFNCAISEGGDCDDVVEGLIDVTFTECSALCAGVPVEGGPTLQECVDQLGCFNGGGRIIEGECVKGTCDDDGETLCGSDEDCADEIDCVRFEDSCAGEAVCSDDLDAPATICPKPGPASSPKTCRDARHNECTIDECVETQAEDSCEGRCGGQAPSGCYCDVVSCSLNDGCADRDTFCPTVCAPD